jgi:hypothetical protein
MRLLQREELPAAVAEALNRTADASTRLQIKNVKDRMTVRTPYTLKSMVSGRARPYQALNKARGKNIDRMFSRVGTVSPYLWMQEGYEKEGFTGPVPIPTLASRVSSKFAKPIRKKFRLTSSQDLGEGAKSPNKDIFIGVPRGTNRKRGVYLRQKRKVKLLRNLEHDTVKIKDTNFHDDAIKRYGTQQYIAAQYRRAAQRRINRRAS